MTPIYPNPKDPIIKAAKTVIKERKSEAKAPSYEPYRPATHNHDSSRYTPGIRQIALVGVKR